MIELESLAEKAVKTFTQRGITLATSESLTGGLVGATITAVPGASVIYLGGVIAYDVQMKAALSGVPKAILDSYGVVSEQTVTEMAVGVQALTRADWAIAVSGVAGPTTQQGHEPGEVWICVAGPRTASHHHFLQSRQFHFDGDRDAVRGQTVAAALEMLLTMVSPV